MFQQNTMSNETAKTQLESICPGHLPSTSVEYDACMLVVVDHSYRIHLCVTTTLVRGWYVLHRLLVTMVQVHDFHVNHETTMKRVSWFLTPRQDEWIVTYWHKCIINDRIFILLMFDVLCERVEIVEFLFPHSRVSSGGRSDCTEAKSNEKSGEQVKRQRRLIMFFDQHIQNNRINNEQVVIFSNKQKLSCNINERKQIKKTKVIWITSDSQILDRRSF